MCWCISNPAREGGEALQKFLSTQPGLPFHFASDLKL